VTPKSQGGKSHSGIPGSKAACAYPGRYRGLPRPSSALKPSHSPDGVGVVGPYGGVCLAFGENLSLRRCFWPMHGVIVSFMCAQFTLHSASSLVQSCIPFLNDVFYVAEFS
jgi:hypothetical protein